MSTFINNWLNRVCFLRHSPSRHGNTTNHASISIELEGGLVILLRCRLLAFLAYVAIADRENGSTTGREWLILARRDRVA